VKRPVRTSEPASDELIHAVRWYEAMRPGLGGEFFDAVVDVMTLIENRPEVGAVSRYDTRMQTRRVLVRRFPYQIVCRLSATEITLVAVAHLKRRPGYWKNRT
jgi:plasmid stabilization system protein ParE